MNSQRRQLLKQALISSTAVTLFPTFAFAKAQGVSTSIKIPKDYAGPSERYLSAIKTHYEKVTLIQEGLVKLTLPSLAENGNSVLLKVSVDTTDLPSSLRVTSLRLFAENNPLPEIAFFDFSENSLPQVALRIRLSASQVITAIATLSDGRHYAGSAFTTITLPACVEAFV